MKKLINKLRRQKKLPPPSRITSETIEQHREHILAGGRKFKYPLQYARHKLVINTIIISITAIAVAIAISWWQLYPAQNTSEFMYRLTKVIPVPVANIDGQPVLYSDYLLSYRSSVYYSEQQQQLNPKNDDGKRQIDYFKQQSMEDAITDAYALKQANRLKISVSDVELEKFIKDKRQSSVGEISQQVFDASTLEILGLSPSEYRHKIKNGLLRQKVSYAMDKDALNASNRLNDIVKNNPNTDLKTLADTDSKTSNVEVVYGVSGWVPKENQDGGLSIEAAKLKKSEVSSAIKSTIGDGYYIIRLLDTNDDRVSYEYIQVPLTTFTNSYNDALSKGKLQKYISIKDAKK